MKEITIDKETIDSIRGFDTEIRLQEIKETIDRMFDGRSIYDSTYSTSRGDLPDTYWTDVKIAKLDYILCEVEVTIHNCKDVKMKVAK